ncbi:MAG: response regulator transcription factor [Eubacteriales bacterium]|nr:response regulator transcription factor [Eubacteriales bacterium]
MSEKILVVEDDRQISNFICFTLKAEGLDYVVAGGAEEALERISSDSPDIIILDLGLPDYDGKEVIRKVREWSEMPIIVVSARDREEEKVAALDLGADDYLTKPFSATELMARVRVARRHLRAVCKPQTYAVLSVRGLKIDLEKGIVHLDGNEIHTTHMEYQLLSYMFRNIGKVLTTKAIIREIWGPGYGTDTQALRALMACLRRKIEKNPGKPEYIITEIGVGYRLLSE